MSNYCGFCSSSCLSCSLFHVLCSLSTNQICVAAGRTLTSVKRAICRADEEPDQSTTRRESLDIACFPPLSLVVIVIAVMRRFFCKNISEFILLSSFAGRLWTVAAFSSSSSWSAAVPPYSYYSYHYDQPQDSSSFRPIPPDAAQELQDYFASTGRSSENVFANWDPSSSLSSVNDMILLEPTTETEASPSYESLEERVRQLEIQLAQLLHYGIPETNLAMETAHPMPSATEMAEHSWNTVPPKLDGVKIKTIQGIPYSYSTTTANSSSNNNNTRDPIVQQNMNSWEEKLKQELEMCHHMKGGWGALCQEQTLRANDDHDDDHNNSNNNMVIEPSKPLSTEIVTIDPRQLKSREIWEHCQSMKRGMLKKELEERGIDTRALLEKSEFVALLVEARLQDALVNDHGDDYVEVREVEVVTGESWQNNPNEDMEIPVDVVDDNEDYNSSNSYSTFTRGIAVNACNGDGLPDIQNFGDGGGAHGGANPFVVAKVRECLANPKAFAKYYSDPDLVAIIREIRQQMP